MIISKERNCIDLTDKEIDGGYVYRIFSIERLLETLKRKKLVLVKPQKWDDPFENYIFHKLSETQKIPKKKEFFEEYKNSLYGQCWTLLEESDAMWRIYAPNKNGVKVKSKIYDLLETVQLKHYHTSSISCYIAKVNYDNLEKLERIYKNFVTNGFSGNSDKDILDLVKSICIKRKEFEHEKEVRLIYYEMWAGLISDIYEIDFDPIYQFDEIVFDPRMNEKDYQSYKKILVKTFGYPESYIKKSKLYTLPEFSLL